MDQHRIQAEIDALAAKSRIVRTPCADDEMLFRCWDMDKAGTVVLFHGGSGSWTHWIRNIEPLGRWFNVVAPDLPGLGDSASLPDGYRAEDAARWVAGGLAQVLGEAAPFHLVGFSWGATVASLVASQYNDRLESLMLVGPAALGMMQRRPQMKPLLRRSSGMSEQQILDVNRENLARLMLHDRGRVDDLAVYLQTQNTNRSRFNSPQFALSSLVPDALKAVTAPLYVVYGEFDAPAYPNFEIREQRLREVRPDLRFEIIEGGGHWLQYELPDVFNARCIDWLRSHCQ
jgi:pimeloyl-ACP methyl ester carboxylesterase